MTRPRIVTLIGLLLFFQGLAFALLASAVMALYSIQRLHIQFSPSIMELLAQLPRISLADLLSVTSLLVLGVFGLVSSVGLLRLRPWGWLMAMIVQGISLVVDLADYLRGNPNYFDMVFSVIVVLYLNQRSIQQIFDVVRYPASQQGDAASMQEQAVAEMTHAEVSHLKQREMR